MTVASIRDEKRWLVGSRGKGRPVDLRPCLDARFSSTDPRNFRRIRTQDLQWDMDRVELLRALADIIHSGTQSEATKAVSAGELKRFLKWVDKRGTKLNRDSIASLLAAYDGDRRNCVAGVRRLSAEALDFSVNERARVFQKPEEQAPDEWILRAAGGGRTNTCDFLRLAIPGDSPLSCPQFAKRRPDRLKSVEKDQSGRAKLVRCIRDEFRAAKTAKHWSDRTQATYFVNVRLFFVWADKEGHHLERSTVVDTLQLYAQHLIRVWRAGGNAKAILSKTACVATVLAKSLGYEPYEIRKTLAQPPTRESGLTSRRPEQTQIDEFCQALHVIIGALPSSVLSKPIPAPLTVSIDEETKLLPEPIGGYGPQTVDARIANIPLTTLRIWSELHRFIAVTGCNLSVAQEITCGQWLANRDGVLEGLKRRAQKFVSLRSSKRYSRHIDAHVEFLRGTLPAPLGEETPLFPLIVTNANGSRCILAYDRSETLEIRLREFYPTAAAYANRWIKRNGIPRINTRQLRQAKSIWLLRRYAGDSLRVAQSLGNTAEVVHRHYGGKGNLESSIVEWKNFWSEHPVYTAIAPGKCAAPGQLETATGSSGSCRDSACLGCRHYRGEDSLDYIHRMLSFQRCLLIRANSNPEVARSIDAIDRIIQDYELRNPLSRRTVQQLRETVGSSPHSDFAAMSALVEAYRAE